MALSLEKLIREIEDRQNRNDESAKKATNNYARHHYAGAVTEANLILAKLKPLVRKLKTATP